MELTVTFQIMHKIERRRAGTLLSATFKSCLPSEHNAHRDIGRLTNILNGKKHTQSVSAGKALRT